MLGRPVVPRPYEYLTVALSRGYRITDIDRHPRLQVGGRLCGARGTSPWAQHWHAETCWDPTCKDFPSVLKKKEPPP